MRISFLIMNAYGMGGTVRATGNLAAELALRHDVEIVSVFRHRDTPFLTLPERVRLSCLVDTRPSGRQWWRFRTNRRLATPSRLFHPQERAYSKFNAETDRVLTRYLARARPDVLITTRPGLNIAAARHARDGVVLIGQEHLHFGAHKSGLRKEIRRWYPKLDAFVTLTKADNDEYSRMLEGAPTLVYTVGNGLPGTVRPRSRLDNRLVLAAGRLVKVKGYDRLLEVFARVVEKQPGWKLRIYGGGPEAESLSRRVQALGLHNHVAFMGATDDMDNALAKASLHVVTSRFEGFGMTIVEALATGVPVVSFDCPQGPGEIISSGHDGVLVPDGDLDAFADTLLALMDAPSELRRLADNGLETADRYHIAGIAEHWEKIFSDLR